MPEGLAQARGLQDGSGLGADHPVKLGQALGDEVGQAPVLEVAPGKLHRVQVRRVGRQALQVQARMVCAELTDERAFVVGAPIPDDDDPTA